MKTMTQLDFNLTERIKKLFPNIDKTKTESIFTIEFLTKFNDFNIEENNSESGFFIIKTRSNYGNILIIDTDLYRAFTLFENRLLENRIRNENNN